MWPFSKTRKSRPATSTFEAFAPLVLASDQVIGPDRLPVRFAYRVAPNNPSDSGWIFTSGEENQEELDANPPKICPLEAFERMDPTLVDIISKPIGSAWERDAADAPWREVHGFEPGD